jgi:hypothetical protein
LEGYVLTANLSSYYEIQNYAGKSNVSEFELQMAWITNDTNTGQTIISTFSLWLYGGIDVCRTSVPTITVPRDDTNSKFTSLAEEDPLLSISAMGVTSEGCDYWTRLVMIVPYDSAVAGSTTGSY